MEARNLKKAMDEKPILSIVVPVYNEEENVRLLFDKIQAICETIGDAYEVCSWTMEATIRPSRYFRN